MSQSILKALWPEKRHGTLKTLGNSDGTGPAIWDPLCKRYYPDSIGSWLFGGSLEKLEDRWDDTSIPEYHRAVFLLTCTRAYVVRKDYARMAKDIGLFLADFYIPEKINHLPAIKAILEGDPDCPAIGLYCRSVVEDPWDGEWNEEKEAYDSLDWSTTFNIYASLDELNEGETNAGTT